jgi:hypothetical protein
MVARIGYRSLLAALLLGLAASSLLAWLPRLPDQVIVQAGDNGSPLADGETEQLRNFFGFHTPESDGPLRFRWTSGEGSFVVRNGARLGAPLLLTMHICGCRTVDAEPPRLWLRVNGETLADTYATAHWGEWRRYHLLLPQSAAPYSPDLLIELLSDTVPNAASGIPLGVAFAQASLSPAEGARPGYDASAAWALGLLAGGLVLAARARGYTGGSAILAGLIATGLIAAQGVFYRPQAIPAEALAIGLLAGAWLATLLADSPGGALALGAAFGALVLAPQVLGAWMLDDAFISFRYARNALLGSGLVFNPGERVEGYTNFLWTVLFVPIIGMGANPALASLTLTLLLGTATAALVWMSARRLAGPVPALAALAILVSGAPFVLYTVRGSGMETALFTLLTLGGAMAYMSAGPRIEDRRSRTASLLSSIVDLQSSTAKSWFTGILLGLAAMTRPEGVLVAGVCGLHILLASYRAGSIAWRRLIALAGGFLAIFGPYYVWRFSYYGYPLPNTFYAKVGGTTAQTLRGLGYAADFARSQAPLLALAVLGFFLSYFGADEGRKAKDDNPTPASLIAHRSSFLWLLVGIYTLYIIAVGGDHFPLYRFFVPLLPLLALLAALGLSHLLLVWPRAAPLAAILASLSVAWQTPQLYESRTLNAASQVWGENSVVEKNREIGLWLRQNTPPGTLIATGIAGALPYYAERPVLDALGLNDLHIAHLDVPTIGQGIAGSEKTDVAYVLGRRPAYIPYNTSEPFKANPAFAESYQLIVVRGPEGRGLRLYKRADIATPETWRSALEQ